MVRIIRFDSLLKYVAYTTVALSIGIYAFVQAIWLPDYSLFKVVTISSIVSTFLVTLLMLPSCSRKIWAFIGYINESIYPDLNGTWQGEITLEDGKAIDVRAVVRQTLLSTEIDIHGETMKSVTLDTTPSMEAGQKKLYYVYRADPKNPAWPLTQSQPAQGRHLPTKRWIFLLSQPHGSRFLHRAPMRPPFD